MKQITIITLIFLIFGQVFGQTDNYGNSVFNSISTKEKEFKDFSLFTNYYTVKNNIENKFSSVFVSENPSLEQIEEFAINLPSDFFLLTKESKLGVMILLQNDPKREYVVIEMKTNKQSFFPCKLIGDITENRANELIKENYDENATISNDKLYFNGKEFKIISNEEIEKAVLSLIKKEKLNKKAVSDIILLSQNEIKSYILSESQENGELDFFTDIKGSEYDGVQIKPGVITTKQSIAFYQWGRACFDIGVNTVEDAYEIFAEHQGKPLNERDKEYIKSGFFKAWEK